MSKDNLIIGHARLDGWSPLPGKDESALDYYERFNKSRNKAGRIEAKIEVLREVREKISEDALSVALMLESESPRNEFWKNRIEVYDEIRNFIDEQIRELEDK